MSWNRPSGVPRGEPKNKPNAMRGIAAGAVVTVALGAVCYFVFGTSHEAQMRKPERKHTAIKEVRHSSARSPKESVQTVQATPRLTGPVKKDDEFKMPAVLNSVELEPGLIVVEAPSGMPSRARAPYKSDVEVYLSMLGEPGTPYTPVPIDPTQDLEADFVKALENKIVIWSDDTEANEAHKRQVHEMKLALEKLKTDKNWKTVDLLLALDRIRRDEWNSIMEAGDIVRNAEETMTPEEAEKVRNQVNSELGELGLKPLKKPADGLSEDLQGENQ